MDDKSNVVASNDAEVETETTAPSTSETETTPKTDQSEVATSEQPAEDGKKPRSEARIQELIKKNKELEAKVDYWDRMAAQPDQSTATEQTDSEFLTADQVAEAVLRKQKAEQIVVDKAKAQTDMQKDAAAALEAHPELQSDDDLATMVVAFAREKRISFTAAANIVKAKMEAESKKAEQKVLASQSMRAGASTPQGGNVSSGGETPIDIANMTEDEKRANWSKIVSSMG